MAGATKNSYVLELFTEVDGDYCSHIIGVFSAYDAARMYIDYILMTDDAYEDCYFKREYHKGPWVIGTLRNDLGTINDELSIRQFELMSVPRVRSKNAAERRKQKAEEKIKPY